MPDPQTLIHLVAPAVAAGVFGCFSALLTSRLVGANERRKLDREVAAKLVEWQRSFAVQYAQIAIDSPVKAAVRQQFAAAYLHFSDRSDRIFIPPGTRLIIGRSEQADISVVDPAISREHAMLDSSNGEYWLADLRSKSGTRINDLDLTGRSRLSHLDVLTFGQTVATFYILDKE